MLILTLPVSILFIINGLIHLNFSLKLKKRYNSHNIYTSVAIVVLWMVAGVFYPFIFPKSIILEALGSVVIVFLTPLLITLILLVEKKIVEKNPSLAKKRTFNKMAENFNAEKLKSGEAKQDVRRKSLHFIPPLIILMIRISFLNTDWDSLKAIIIIIGYSGVLLFSALDFIMHSFVYGKKSINYLLPDKISAILAKTMKKQELYEPLKVVPLVLGLLPSLLFPFSVFLSTALVASLSDGAASVAGHLIGKIHFPRKSKKTIIGYVAGGITSFLLISVTFTLFDTIPLSSILALSLAGMISFLAIDIFNSKIDDNVLNPLATGIILGLAYLTVQ